MSSRLPSRIEGCVETGLCVVALDERVGFATRCPPLVVGIVLVIEVAIGTVVRALVVE